METVAGTAPPLAEDPGGVHGGVGYLEAKRVAEGHREGAGVPPGVVKAEERLAGREEVGAAQRAPEGPRAVAVGPMGA